MNATELARAVPVERIGSVPHAETLVATAAECAALAQRFGWLALDRLAADVTLTATAAGISAVGTVRAALTQACVVTGDPVASVIDVPFQLRLVAANSADEGDDERELEEDDLDVVTHDGVVIELGEAVAQTLALSVDPYPRSPDADARRGTLRSEEAGPFAGLKALLAKGDALD